MGKSPLDYTRPRLSWLRDIRDGKYATFLMPRGTRTVVWLPVGLHGTVEEWLLAPEIRPLWCAVPNWRPHAETATLGQPYPMQLTGQGTTVLEDFERRSRS